MFYSKDTEAIGVKKEFAWTKKEDLNSPLALS